MASLRPLLRAAALRPASQLIRSAPRASIQRQPFIRNTTPVFASPSSLVRTYATAESSAVEAPDFLDENERKIFDMLKESLQPTKLEVQDISGGCGSMYALDVVSKHFKGLTVIKQHRLVNKILADEIKKWHGVQLKTKAPES